MSHLQNAQCCYGEVRGAAPRFEELLPAIQRVVAFALRRVSRARRSELMEAAVARAYEMYVRLVQRGKGALAYATVLANYAVRQVLDGRSTGNSRNVWEVLSPYAQRKQSFVVIPVTTADLTDHRQTDPAELAALRIDFSAWLSGLTSFKRHLAVYLAVGHTTNEAARRFRVSAARVSQVRRELQRAWQLFQGIQLG